MTLIARLGLLVAVLLATIDVASPADARPRCSYHHHGHRYRDCRRPHRPRRPPPHHRTDDHGKIDEMGRTDDHGK